MLGQQYYSKPEYGKFLDENFVLYRASRGDKAGEQLFTKYRVLGTPFILFLDGDGKEVDWVYGYSAPPEKLHEKILRVLKGEDTFKSLKAQNVADSKNVGVLSKLADKYDARFIEEEAVALWKQVIALDPEGRSGTTEYLKKKVSYTESAEFKLAQASAFGQARLKREAAPMERFLEKHPQSPLRLQGFTILASHYTSGRVPQEEVERFFDKAFSEFPGNSAMKYYYASFAVRNRKNLERAIQVIEDIDSFPAAIIANTKAELYALNNEMSKAEASYGSEYADNLAASTASSLWSYARFWIQKKANLESAEKALKTSISLAPENLNARESLAGLYLDAGKTDQALEVYGPSIVDLPGIDAYGITRYARFWISKKQNEAAALEALEKSVKLALATGDEMANFAIQNAAVIFAQAGKSERVMEFYGPAFAKEHWDDPEVLSAYARYWAGKKTNLDSALPAAEQSLKLPEPYPGMTAYYLSTLGAVYEALGRLEDAKNAMEKALAASNGQNTEYYESQLKKIQAEIDKKKK